MPRERTTWNRNEIARMAGLKVADPYTMNQSHPQPSADEYVIGDASSFAEDVHPSSGTWEAEYAGGQVKRNEIGMPEFREDTFNHAEKTASEEVLTKKAALCVAISRAILPKTASSSDIENQSVSLMYLPDSEVMSTYSRLAAQDQEEEEDDSEDQGQNQKQAQQQQEEDDFEGQTQGQRQKQKQAQQQQLAQLQQQAQQLQQQLAQIQQQMAQQQQKPVAQGQVQQQAQQIQQQMAQQQQQMAQQQQKPVAQGQQNQFQAVAQAVQQAIAQGQDPVQAVQQCMTQNQVAQDADLIDAMLAQDSVPAPTAEMDIQMEPPMMDVGDVQLQPEDDVLNQLFASNSEVRLAQQAQGQDPEAQEQAQQKQAHVVRTASMRTVGTRPTAGVSQIGGHPSVSTSGGDKLSSLWNSAPDVREAFGLPTNR